VVVVANVTLPAVLGERSDQPENVVPARVPAFYVLEYFQASEYRIGHVISLLPNNVSNSASTITAAPLELVADTVLLPVSAVTVKEPVMPELMVAVEGSHLGIEMKMYLFLVEMVTPLTDSHLTA
jgi:hypothetical protein